MQPEEEMQGMQMINEQMGIAGAVGQQAQSTATQQYYLQEQEKTLAESQLDCDKTLIEIYHLLKQDVLKPGTDGSIDWHPIDTKDRALTDMGVDRIMQVMRSYVNKETLLSNFDDVMINRRMLEFAYALNANIFMKYELYFRKPTFEECKDILKDRVAEKVKIKMYAKEVLNIPTEESDVKRQVIAEIEDRIEYELNKIKTEKIRQNLREYELLFVQLKAIVEATHNRAWKGEERGSLRRHTNISEVIANRMPNQKENGGGIFKWMGS